MKMLDRSKLFHSALLLVFWFTFWGGQSPAHAEDAVVRAVLFFSPSCPHCHQVIEEVLPPLFEKYGEQLDMVGIDTTTSEGSALFGAAIQRFAIPPEKQAVPMLIIGETVLLGSLDIPQQFPKLIEFYLAKGGVDWPDIPGLPQAQTTAQPELTLTTGAASMTDTPAAITPQTRPTQTPKAAAQPSPTAAPAGLMLPNDSNPGVNERLARDPLGNSMAIVVLLAMLLSIAETIKRLRPSAAKIPFIQSSIWIPVLCLIGMCVAGYLAYVETAQVEAVCGPVGDCNTVQQSEYARLFGVLPIGVMGLVGYMAILAAWLVVRFGSTGSAHLASRALMAMTLIGVLFSIYLTFLEPFVIGATCAWCLTSAIIMTLLLWCSIAPGRLASGN